MSKNPLLELAGQITEQNLTDLDAKIDQVKKELAGLRKLRAVAAAFLGKEAPKRTTRTPAATSPLNSARQAPNATGIPPLDGSSPASILMIAKAIAKHGPMMPAKIVQASGLSEPAVYKALKHRWFKREPDGWHLLTEGLTYLKERDD